MVRRYWLAGAFILASAAAAHAQGAPTEPAAPPPPGPGMEMRRPPMDRGGPMGMHRHGMMMMQRSAGFRFKRDGAEIDIRCAGNEPMRACVDAASVLIDKVAATAAPK